jgi:hypothetical protein
MMGGETPETCWATHKRQVINLWNCCILLVELFESYDDVWTCERQKVYIVIGRRKKIPLDVQVHVESTLGKVSGEESVVTGVDTYGLGEEVFL